jgi:hypothetical protein
LFLQMNCLCGLEDAAMSRNGFRGNMEVGMARKEERSLESLTLGFAQERPRTILVGDGIKPPRCGLRVTIPRYINRSPRGSLFGNNGRLFRGITRPVVPEGTVIFDTFTKQTRVHVRVKNRSTIRLELGHGSLRAPVDQSVTIGEKLGATLGLSK